MSPISTYRLQFRGAMDFSRASRLVPYLKRLGISHLYASPIFSAATGSTHGYDVVDHNQIDPALGGREGFDRLSRALKASGLGLILDIVPNHMAASTENAWWLDVLTWGKDSRFASHFDIDWHDKLTLPILGKPLAEVLSAGELKLDLDRPDGVPALAYFDHVLPLHPPSVRLLEDVGVRDTLRPHRELLERLLDAQPWQLLPWQDARRHLSYRRFFEITSLVGVRVEVPEVYSDVHRLTLELVRNGQVHGLRVDHVDGLTDPAAYLRRLRHDIGPDIHLVVEKIFDRGETLPLDWPVDGTTGYEFIDAAVDLLVCPAGAAKLAATYRAVSARPRDLEAERRAAKHQLLRVNFATELSRLVQLACEALPWLDPEDVETVIVELVCALPVYRTYGDSSGLSARDREVLELAAKTPRAAGLRGIDAVLELLAAPDSVFRLKFQQLSGPVMAKSVEDTLFYRYNALLALNEVGGDPARPVGSVERFHAAMKARQATQPAGLVATSTHDTKRGEDARARLYALAEAPGMWAAAVERWRSVNAGSVRALPDGPAPEPETEWLIYQALAGVWPAGLSSEDRPGLATVEARFLAYLEKAMREAKLRTSWGEVDAEYEAAVAAYAKALFAPGRSSFLSDFAATLAPILEAGAINSLVQTLAKLTVPGIPDIYQGSELMDLSLVDPDNRRDLDFPAANQGLSVNLPYPQGLADGRLKQRLIAQILAFRTWHHDLFEHGSYEPLAVVGRRAGNLAAFVRGDRSATVAIVLPRLVLGVRPGDTEYWKGTHVTLPEAAAWKNVLTGDRLAPETAADAAMLAGNFFPMAVLLADRSTTPAG